MEFLNLLIVAVTTLMTSQKVDGEVLRRQSEIVDLNVYNRTSHVIEGRILNGVNKTGSLTVRNYVERYYSDAPPLPVSIEVQEGSTLTGEPGRVSTISFQITSNLPGVRQFYFTAEDTGGYLERTIPQPSQASISYGNTVQSRLILQPQQGRGSNPSIITFYVIWDDPNRGVRKKVYFYVGSESYDSYSPDIWYDYDGDCYGSVSPRNCRAKNWKAIVNIQDSGSGLLSIRSDPPGLLLEKEFIVGSKEAVKGYYTSSCCQTKVDITAKDILGNVRVKSIDIEKKWLSAGDISAIVLACLLLLIIIAFVTWLIVRCCRRRKSTLSLYTSQTRRPE